MTRITIQKLQKAAGVILFMLLSHVAKAGTCDGSEFLVEFTEQNLTALIYRGDTCLAALSCTSLRDETNQGRLISCKEPSRIDEGFELVPIANNLFKLYELSFAGKRQADVIVCERGSPNPRI